MIETINDALTAAQIQAACARLDKEAGGDGCSTAMVSATAYSNGDIACVMVSHARFTKNEFFRARSWPEAFRAAHVWVSTHKAIRRNAIVRRMALAVLEITDERGTCTDTLLLGKDFTAAEIVEFHEAACVLDGNSPFVVVFAAEAV